MKVSCGRWSDEPLAEGNCASASERGEEAGEQTLDLTDRNCVRRRGALGELAEDSEAQRGPKRPHVDAARVRGKLSHLIRGDLSHLREGQESAEAIVVGGVATTQGGQGNLTTGRRAERLRS